MITTLHAAKGLEADRLIVAGLADQVLPGIFKDQDQHEERRRLLYVAVTRAREHLIVSWPHKIRLKDAQQNKVRIDRTSWKQGETWVELGRSSLLPADFPGPLRSCGQWLRDVGAI